MTTLSFTSIYDFKEYLDNGILTDCVLVCGDKEYKAHRIVLANSAKFFYNSFTCGMEEEKLGKVNIECNPGNAFPLVLKWLYDGKISFPAEQLIDVIEVARFYSVTVLCEEIDKYLKDFLMPDNIIEFFETCYQKELDNAPLCLAHHLAPLLSDVDMEKLTNTIEVKHFAEALKEFPGNLATKIDLTNKFLGDYKVNNEESESLKLAFSQVEKKQKVYQDFEIKIIV